MKEPQVAFVVCPTEYGGQIEHAFDTAVALSQNPNVERSVLVTRLGAKRYLARMDFPDVEIREVLPPRRLMGSLGRNTVRPALQLKDLLMEHIIIRRQLSRSRRSNILVVLDTARYPRPRILIPPSSVSRLVMFVHNAKPHIAAERRSIRHKFLWRLERSCINGVDLAVTHGDVQLQTLKSLTKTRVASVQLPEASFLDSPSETGTVQSGHKSPYALCIGELRENKGIETAIVAAGIAEVPLLIAGKSDDRDMADRLNRLALLNPKTRLRDEFLERREFDGLIQDASIVVLPYIHFDAQSGILAKAMKSEKFILASDLPSLREQAGDYARIRFFPVAQESALASALIESMLAGQTQSAFLSSSADPSADWKPVVDVLLADA